MDNHEGEICNLLELEKLYEEFEAEQELKRESVQAGCEDEFIFNEH